jgi:hypothetical protein
VDRLFWFFQQNGAFDVISGMRIPLLICFVLYQFDYLLIVLRRLVMGARGAEGLARLSAANAPSALIVMPTLLRVRDELEGLKRAILSAANNGYPGALYIVASIDDAATNRAIFRELQAWMESVPRTPNVTLLATGADRRRGKAVAIDLAVAFFRARIAAGEIAELPLVFFNMDGDSELGPDALERMVARLMHRSSWSGARPMIVTSNVCIAPDVAWRGWRAFFSVKGQIALGVAREYLTSIAIGKFNSKLIPVQEASGALYCTWSELHELAPRWAAFMQTLRLRDWLMWWLGAAPPCFMDSAATPLPEAQTGPGDDTWMTWLACCARWQDGALTVEFPRTPAHAFAYAVRDYFFRPLAYEPAARISTKTPTTIKALFKQRVRWNSSRIQDIGRWRPALMYHFSAALAVIFASTILLYVHAMIVASLVVWPFTTEHTGGPMVFLVALGMNLTVRAYATVIALIVDGSLRRSWRTLLAVPMSVPYHFLFNILPTIVGATHDLLLFGVNTNFSPEETYVKSRLSRVALAYRLRRAFALAWRSVIHNDVPLGAFWFGWYETKWTPNGFEGWTSGKKRVLVARSRRRRSIASPSIRPTKRVTMHPRGRPSVLPSLRPSMVPSMRASMRPSMAAPLPCARLDAPRYTLDSMPALTLRPPPVIVQRPRDAA